MTPSQKRAIQTAVTTLRMLDLNFEAEKERVRHSLKLLVDALNESMTAVPLVNLQKDAERYRKLRALHWSDAELAVVKSPRHNIVLGATCPSGEHLDSLIDKM